MEAENQQIHENELICKKCKNHLGHRLKSSKSLTGDHDCINSACLKFKEKTFIDMDRGQKI